VPGGLHLASQLGDLGRLLSERAGTIATAFVERAAMANVHWLLGAWGLLFAAGAGLARSHGLQRRDAVLGGAVAVVAVLIFATYVLSPHDVVMHLKTSLTRLLIFPQLLPPRVRAAGGARLERSARRRAGRLTVGREPGPLLRPRDTLPRRLAGPSPRMKPSSRIEEVGAAALAGIAAYAASCLVEPATSQIVAGFGMFWQEMSTQPFAFVGDLPHRMLAPLLAHLVGLDGERYTDFTRLTGVLMLSLVYAVCRQRGSLRVDALLVTLAIAFTGATQIYKRGMVGYCDNLGYSLFLVGVLVSRHAWAFWPVFFLNLVNHDMALFFLPWLWFLRRQHRGVLRWDVWWCFGALVAYWYFRDYVAQNAATWKYDEAYFLKHCFLPIGFLWLWLLAAVHVLLQFGPFLAILLWHSWWPRPPHERVHTLLVLLGIGGIFGFAYDVMRHPNMIFLPIVFASTRFLVDARSRVVYLLAIAAMIVLYREFTWLEPGGPPSQGWLFEWVMAVMVFDCQGHLVIDASFRFDLGAHWNLLVCSAQRVWPVFFRLAWEVLAIVAVSRWLIRRNIGGPRWRA
jgi:hypothetical protein